ncbi:MAG TPA: NAD(P)H-hydrate dehydratase [Ideonella sp.]|uniref:NAD(P)H-hydrate dehydratase n=1 Tax=Ideonella sp. TaxID=1929293 RepID=UPI002B614A9B|nr:NAD(P)H-hydrate dehydratase [Ideonella sp.]HSI49468.1 NAD(P)H-hydrate dehydratase [Ideonella sp.]
MHRPVTPDLVSPATLRDWPLPVHACTEDKESRGRALVIAGSREMAGAAILAGTAALRAGAGKLVIATAERLASRVAVAMPEARVVALPETAAGGFTAEGASLLAPFAKRAHAMLIGPGMLDEPASCAFVHALLAEVATPVVLDAGAMGAVNGHPRFESPVLLTPHAGEMAHLTGNAKEAILANPLPAALDAARRWHATVALKGACTCIAAADGRCWQHEAGNAGLATSGSGDALAGIITGLAARGASLEQAAAWGVALHAAAGRVLAERLGPIGFLARELPQEIPALMHAWGG